MNPMHIMTNRDAQVRIYSDAQDRSPNRVRLELFARGDVEDPDWTATGRIEWRPNALHGLASARAWLHSYGLTLEEARRRHDEAFEAASAAVKAAGHEGGTA